MSYPLAFLFLLLYLLMCQILPLKAETRNVVYWEQNQQKSHNKDVTFNRISNHVSSQTKGSYE